MGPRAGTMLGMGRTVRGETLVEYESVLIREQEGRLAYEAHPSGQPAARFVAIRATETEVIFENPEHDYPQRVGYRRDGPDALTGWIDGTDQGAAEACRVPVSPGRVCRAVDVRFSGRRLSGGTPR